MRDISREIDNELGDVDGIKRFRVVQRIFT